MFASSAFSLPVDSSFFVCLQSAATRVASVELTVSPHSPPPRIPSRTCSAWRVPIAPARIVSHLPAAPPPPSEASPSSPPLARTLPHRFHRCDGHQARPLYRLAAPSPLRTCRATRGRARWRESPQPVGIGTNAFPPEVDTADTQIRVKSQHTCAPVWYTRARGLPCGLTILVETPVPCAELPLQRISPAGPC
jgi:hypothetical protein